MPPDRWTSRIRRPRCENNWYANLDVLQMQELRQVGNANARPKRMVSDLTLGQRIVKEVVKGKSGGTSMLGDRTVNTRLRSDRRTSLPPIDAGGA